MARVVVGVDGSAAAAEALRWAVAEGERRRWPVVAVLAVDGDGAAGQDQARRAASAVVDGALGGAAGEVSVEAASEPPAAALASRCGPGDLAVVGSRGSGGFRSLLLGSVGTQLLHHAPCPVVVVRSPAGAPPEPPGRVVVGVDGSEPADAALAWAVEAARLRGALLEVVHCWTPPLYALPLATVAFDADRSEAAAMEVLAAALERVDTGSLEPPPEALVRFGPAASALLDASDGSDLLVVGSRGRGGFAGLLLGSVSNQVAHHATCPVAVVRA